MTKLQGSSVSANSGQDLDKKASRIEKKLSEARSRLLDLSLRNRLVNFRPSVRRSIRIVEGNLSEIYQQLVLDERSLSFAAQKPSPTAENQREDAETSQSEIAEPQAKKRRASLQLQTELDPDILPKRLFGIANEANSVLEEQGYTVLYLALGFLEWKDSPASETFRKAPLILIPIDLSRTKVRESYRLNWTKEDIGTNLSLGERLLENGIALDEFEMPEDSQGIDDYLASVSKAIRKQSEWRVTKNVYLGFFSFTKFVMYKDLDPEEWPDGQGPASHPLIKRLFDPSEEKHAGDLYDEQEIDDRLDWKLAHYVLDADPSQIVAIETVKAGRDLVVEGPPGTGKSQTIANLIGELLMQKKTVLFVSEKMAALEVVKQRLDKIGLGEFCLELHSRKSRKKEVLEELQRCLQHPLDAEKTRTNRGRNQLEKEIGDLNEYARQLRDPFGSLQMSPYELIGMNEEARSFFDKVQKDIPEANPTSTTPWTMEKVDESITALEDLVELRDMLTSKAVAAWSLCNPGRLLPHDIDDIRAQLRATLQSVNQFVDCGETLKEALGSSSVRALKMAPNVREAFEAISTVPDISAQSLQSPGWRKWSLDSIDEHLEPVASAQHLREQVARLFKEEALSADAEDLRNRLAKARTGTLYSFKRDYRSVAREVNRFYRTRPSFFFRGYADDLQLLAQYSLKRMALEQAASEGAECFGNTWDGEDSSVEALRLIATWVLKYHKGIDAGTWSPSLLDKATDGFRDIAETLEKIEAFEALAVKTEAMIQDALETLGCSEVDGFGCPADEATLPAIADRLASWLDSIDELGIWERYQAQRSLEILSDLSDLVVLVDQHSLNAEDIAPAIRYCVTGSQLRGVFAEREALATFVSKLHEKKINSFRKLDRSIIEANHALVCSELRERRPRLIGGVSPESGMGILLREIGKKKRHISIRKLMEAAGPFIQKAKPCFMMSPLSIAQFLDPHSTKFDVIIFDEASQVRPEDALGALLRGNQLVVMGDTKQLPPTSFFDRLVEDADDEDDRDSVADIESILHLCRRSFPSKNLRWHYRSRHESLIAVSNHEFYDNNLVFYPSPMQKTEGLGLKFRHIPDTIYDRGKSAENRQEAIAVARAAIQHYKKTPNLSLGVGAFSSKQQNAILEEVHRELEEHPEMETYFASSQPEHFFVKNLETIQGDERDVIFLSIGYGFDREHKLSRNFGPVNREGGERRLNVLITRSRRQCVVFSNFTGEDLAVDATGARGVRALKTFLKYAETGKLNVPEASGRDTDSPFEDVVYEFLSAEGHEVKKQVGEAGFRIDLAVVDPAKPGRFILGVECDGAKYHSSRVARERDRLRQQILEGLGWRIHRVWSTDWFTRRKDAQEQLLRAVDEAKSNLDSAKTILEASETEPNLDHENHAVAIEKANKQEPHGLETQLAKQELPTQPYVECQKLRVLTDGKLADAPRTRLADAIKAVVEVEGPVHVDEVVRRIRTLWGLKRSGSKIQEAVARGIQYAVSQKMVEHRKKFLWEHGQKDVQARYRIAREMLKIELICDREIEDAVFSALKIQLASPRDAIPTTAARLLGFQQTSEQIRKRIDKVVGRMLKNGEVVETGNGMLDVQKGGEDHV